MNKIGVCTKCKAKVPLFELTQVVIETGKTKSIKLLCKECMKAENGN